jgi:hypothetical protein
MVQNKTQAAPWQTRPVFVSSTFMDMQAEREYLRQVVCPRVEEELCKGRILLESIDLRQGVETLECPTVEIDQGWLTKRFTGDQRADAGWPTRAMVAWSAKIELTDCRPSGLLEVILGASLGCLAPKTTPRCVVLLRLRISGPGCRLMWT